MAARAARLAGSALQSLRIARAAQEGTARAYAARQHEAVPQRALSTAFNADHSGDCFRTAYAERLRNGLHADAAQRAAAEVLGRVGDDVHASVRASAARNPFSRALQALGVRRDPAVRGAYLCGGVGSGKTLLAELLYECVPAAVRKRQVHFHAFVLDVHARLHAKRGAGAADKIAAVATDLAAETRFLMLDEVQVTDVSDAVVVHHLFRRLFELGVTLVATSNRVPERLYEGGLQRELFLPVIPLIRRHCEVHVMGETRDYRLRNARADRRVWFRDHHGGARAVHEVFDALAEGFPAREARLEVLGRKLVVPMAVGGKAVAFFSFEELCNRPLSAADYIALCATYHTICVTDVPVIDVVAERNASRRFTKFVDEAYRVGTKVVVNAAEGIENIFVRPVETSAQTEEAFESQRIESRLFEMQTDEYLEREWRPRSGDRMKLETSTEKDVSSKELVDAEADIDTLAEGEEEEQKINFVQKKF